MKSVTVEAISVTSPVDTSKQVQAKPVMVFAPFKAGAKRGEKLHKPLAENTIASYFRKVF